MKERGATITMQDMVAYYDRILENATDLSDRARQYLSELRDQTAKGVFVVPDKQILASMDSSQIQNTQGE